MSNAIVRRDVKHARLAGRSTRWSGETLNTYVWFKLSSGTRAMATGKKSHAAPLQLFPQTCSSHAFCRSVGLKRWDGQGTREARGGTEGKG